MKIKQKINVALLSLLSVMTLSTIPVMVGAATKCGDIDTSIIGGDACKDVTNKGTVESNGVWALLIMGINILTAGIGIAAVGGVIYGSILYTTAGDNEAQIKQAKEVIRNVIIGVIMYVAMYAVLQFIIPGGIFT